MLRFLESGTLSTQSRQSIRRQPRRRNRIDEAPLGVEMVWECRLMWFGEILAITLCVSTGRLPAYLRGKSRQEKQMECLPATGPLRNERLKLTLPDQV